MITGISYLLLGIYTLSLMVITAYCLMQFHLLYHFNKKMRPEIPDSKDIKDESLPLVTIQLPVFNEKYVLERLVDTVVEFDYPKEKMQIHILDDSTDETLEISKKKVAEYKAKGYDIEVFHRTDRSGYKAGALKAGMPHAKGKFIAIFDADFVPEPDFLKKTIPFFKDSKVGVVQTRWEHINQGYSILTEMQAFQLNVHFTVEQTGRDQADYLLQFNGTAGVWRRETIDSAGGWEADTLTEDLDLSYRAQLKGWKIKFLVDVTSPAELPAEMNGLKSQQYRWMKGGAETAKKLLPTVWKSDLGLVKKLHASSHLLSSSVFLGVFMLGVFSVPLLFLIIPMGIDPKYFGAFLISLLTVIFVYFAANVGTAWKNENRWRMIVKFILIFPLFLAISMGLSLHNSIAVLQGYRGKKSAFVRTPKYGIKTIADTFKKGSYWSKKISAVTILEGILAIYFGAAAVAGIMTQNYIFLALHIMLLIGYGYIFFLSLKHAR